MRLWRRWGTRLYAHDFSEFHALELGQDGRVGYPQLPLYWTDAARHPFLIEVDGKLAGLAFVKQGSEVTGDRTVWDMAEFFVTRGHRRRGVGEEAARQVWRRFPGRWEVRVMEENKAARRFWKAAIMEYSGEEARPSLFMKGAARWLLFAFASTDWRAAN